MEIDIAEIRLVGDGFTSKELDPTTSLYYGVYPARRVRQTRRSLATEGRSARYYSAWAVEDPARLPLIDVKKEMRDAAKRQREPLDEVDPLAKKYPGWRPYNYVEDDPAVVTDPNGQGIWDKKTEQELKGELQRSRAAIKAEGEAWKKGDVLGVITSFAKGVWAKIEISSHTWGLMPEIGAIEAGGEVSTRFIVGAEVEEHGNSVAKGTVDLQPTIDAIEKGTVKGEREGIEFANRGPTKLPTRPEGYYREYTLPTPGSEGRGAQRIVVGNGGEVYYTPNHYKSFIRVR